MTMVTIPLAVVIGVVFMLLTTGALEARLNDELWTWLCITVVGCAVSAAIALGCEATILYFCGV